MNRKFLVAVFGCGMVALQITGCGPPRVSPPPPPQAPPSKQAPPPAAEKGGSYTATAYSSGSKTAAGDAPRSGVVAADPNVLPLGSRIRVTGAGQYSGEYEVKDTGKKIRGRKIDIYVPKRGHAKQFGRRKVKVSVVRYGPHKRRLHHGHQKHRVHQKPAPQSSPSGSEAGGQYQESNPP